MTARLTTGLFVVALALSASVGVAGPLSRGTALIFSTASVAQAPTTEMSPTEKRAQADDLLQRARQAMKENDLSAAYRLLTKANSLGVDYGPWYFGDTPKKALADLQARQSAVRPSQVYSPAAIPQPGVNDPFAAHAYDANPGADATPGSRLPPVDLTSPAARAAAQQASNSPFGTAPMTAPPERDDQLPTMLQRTPPPASAAAANVATSNQFLLDARRALGYGDVRRANLLLQQAKSMQVARGLYDDTPENVEHLIRKFTDFQSLPSEQKTTEAYQREYARLTLEQAEGLLRRGDCTEAERLANHAAGLPVVYGPLDVKPEALLQRIAAARRSAGAPQPPVAMAQQTPAPVAYAQPAAQASPSTQLMVAKQKVVELTRQARQALARRELSQAELLAAQAEQYQVPDSAYSPGEDRPGLVQAEVRRLRFAATPNVVSASAVAPPTVEQWASPAIYNPATDRTQNVQAAATLPQVPDTATLPAPPVVNPEPAAVTGPALSADPHAAAGMALYQQGEEALQKGESQRALQLFRQAYAYHDYLDAHTAQQLQDKLQMLTPSQSAPRTPVARTLADEAVAKQQLQIRQVESDVQQETIAAKALMAKDPKKAIANLEQLRERVAQAGLEASARDQLLRRVDRTLGEMRQFVDENRPRIELAEHNDDVRREVARAQQAKLSKQEKLAQLVNQYNQLMEDQRYEEARVVAKQASELDPRNPVCVQIEIQSRMADRLRRQLQIRADKEEGFVNAMESVDKGSIPFDDRDPYRFQNAKDWKKLTASRRKLADRHRQQSDRDLEIMQKLKTPVQLDFESQPLGKVIDKLGKLGGINIFLDPEGLSDEGVTTDTPVSIKLANEISLKSALNLILPPLHLNFMVKDEVLKITSERQRQGQLFTQTYNVADLVVPIPNFTPGPMGLEKSINNAMATLGLGGPNRMGGGASPLAAIASTNGAQAHGQIAPAIMAQQAAAARNALGGTAPMNPPNGAGGPGGLRGGSGADFDSLIELITSTVKPSTWDAVGGPGSIAGFETNLSLVVSQTQDVHDEIRDLLEQLRRLQDLQVTIEVRFITLNDNFFERIGVDFSFEIPSGLDNQFQVFGSQQPGTTPAYSTGPFNTGTGPARNTTMGTLPLNGSSSATVGMSAPGVFSADMNIPFTQGSYALATPQFGGFDPTAGASLGFAILSDIEAYFFITAAQGDQRSNVLQAPKVTLFNGQQAYVSDTSQSPFVISVIPVVGDFAAAQEPVIIVLSEGTFLTVQAVVSNDRRFVRLTVVPFFSNIGAVNTFTFTGTTSTTSNSSTGGIQTTPNNNTTTSNAASSVTSGTTVQLPTFSFVTVTTTVSVPDGGTVLLGGIKRLSEGRTEYGVPILNKIPYINRLFKNTGIGRETQSLMMMVTPRIIIQEEEEDRLGVTSTP